MINYEKDNMKLISEDLENKKAYLERQNSLEIQNNKNRRVVEEEAKRYLEEKINLEEQI